MFSKIFIQYFDISKHVHVQVQAGSKCVSTVLNGLFNLSILIKILSPGIPVSSNSYNWLVTH